MKKVIISFLVLGLLGFTGSYAAGFGEYSHGFRMGELTKFSVKGFVFKSGEGQMLVGSESSPLVITETDSDGNTKKKVINPWYFSVSPDNMGKMKNKMMSELGNYVVIEYKQSHVKSPKVDTDYEPVAVLSITKPINKVCVAKKFDSGSNSEGVRVGRIVKASNKGRISNSYEITIQMGNSGNQFKNMSISEDDKLYECAIEYLKAGQKVKIYYDESFFNLNRMNRNTKYDIVKIEPIKTGLN